MEALVATVPVSTEQSVVVLLHGPVSIDISLVLVKPFLILVDEALSSIEFPC